MGVSAALRNALKREHFLFSLLIQVELDDDIVGRDNVTLAVKVADSACVGPLRPSSALLAKSQSLLTRHHGECLKVLRA